MIFHSYVNVYQKVSEPRKGYDNTDLVSIIKHHKPDVLIGAVGKAPGCFTEEPRGDVWGWGSSSIHMMIYYTWLVTAYTRTHAYDFTYDCIWYINHDQSWSIHTGYSSDIHRILIRMIMAWVFKQRIGELESRPGGGQGHAGRPSGQSNARAAHHLRAVQSHESGRDHSRGEVGVLGVLGGVDRVGCLFDVESHGNCRWFMMVHVDWWLIDINCEELYG